MLKNIKSSYITKILFDALDEKRKLLLVKYNKTLQNTIDASIINYELFIETYIENNQRDDYNINNNKILYEFESNNGKGNIRGKEYNEVHNILFEGEYKDWKRHGKGKEYYNNCVKHIYVNQKIEIKLKYEGEYINGKKWTGKGYDFYKKLAYEIKNGNGFIKEYHDNGKLKYEGNYLNGDKNGKGKEYFSNGKLKFEGEYKNGLIWTG